MREPIVNQSELSMVNWFSRTSGSSIQGLGLSHSSGASLLVKSICVKIPERISKDQLPLPLPLVNGQGHAQKRPVADIPRESDAYGTGRYIPSYVLQSRQV